MTSDLISRIDQLAGHRVVVVGDLMLDRFVYGRVDRISPEAPIPVIHVEREATTLGGAGNVVRNLISLGGTVGMVAVIGDDATGRNLVQEIKQMEGVQSYLFADNARPTTIKTRYVAGGQQLLRADNELAKPLSEDMEQRALDSFKEAAKYSKIIVLSDYAKGVLTPRVMSEIIKTANESGCKVLIDPKGRDYSRYRGSYILTPNRKELSEAIGYTIGSVEDAEKAARYLIDTHGLSGMLAKMGGDGVCLVMKDQKAQHFHTLAREVFDVSGAGDTVMATLALALAGDFSEPEAAELANIAGSVVVGKIGTASVSRDELARELMHERSVSGEQKIVTVFDAPGLTERWRKKGYKVGFTNGVFDLLHPGHISLLRQARASCDKLLVGLNSDASVKRLKGERRPIQNEASRAAVLASLADVDGVVIFREDTPYELIRETRPDVLIKGADYTVEKVVGYDLVQAWKGKIILADLVAGQSTTATIAKIGSR